MEEISPNLQVAEMKVDNLRKAYDQLQAQASSFLLFSLQWKDLQEHFDSIRKSIGDRLESLNLRVKEVELNENQLRVTQESLDECSKLLHEKEERLRLVKKSLDKCCEEVDLNGKQLGEIKRLIQGTSDELGLKEKHLNSVKVLIQDHVEELERKEKDWEVLQKSIAVTSAQLDLKENELVSVQKSLSDHLIKIKAKENKLLLIEKDIEERSKVLENKEKQLGYVQRQLRSCRQDIELKEREYGAIRRNIEERNKEFEIEGEKFKSIQKSITEREERLRSKEEEYNRDLKMVRHLITERDEVLKSIQRSIEECNRDLGTKEHQLNLIEGLIIERERERKSKDTEYHGILENMKNDYERKEGELESIQKKISQCDEELKTKEEALDSIQKSILGLAKELESKRKFLYDLAGKEEEFKSMQTKISQRVGELESKEKDFDSLKLLMKERSLELEMKEKQFEERVRNLESKEKQFGGQVKKLELKEKQFERRVEELKSKEKQLERRVKELESKEKQFESSRKSFEEKRMLKEKSNILLPQVKTEQLDFIDASSVKNSRNLQALFNELLKKYESVCHEVSVALRASMDPAKLVLDAMQGFYPPHSRQGEIEYDENIIRRSSILLLDELKKSSPVISSHVKEESMKLAREWRANMSVANKDCLEVLGFLKFVATYELGSSFDANELQMLLDIISQHCQASELRQALDNQSSATRDGRNLQLLSNQQTNAPELMNNDIFVDLQASDPAKLVLDLILNPIVPQSQKGEESAIIVENRIFLLEQLMRISPDIKPHVREEAMKLALELKAKMRASTEKSLEVLVFLLLLSIYGLVSSFNEDEILKLLEIAAQHKQVVELFGTLGFADKISDFVQNLIKKQQHVEAVKFICAYELADKIPPVDLLREYVQNAKMVSRRLCKKTKSVEIKEKARDEEVACLGTVLKCISDNKLESQNLVKEIQNRIGELERLKANRGPSSNVKAIQPEQKKRNNEGVRKKYQVQRCGNNNKRPRTAVAPSVTPVFTPTYEHRFRPFDVERVILPNGMPAQFGLPTNNLGPATPMGAGQFGWPRPF